MPAQWTFDPQGPEFRTLNGPVPLVVKRMGLPARPGLYVITCGDSMPHVGTSGRLSGRVHMLAALGTHRGSAELLSAAFCTGEPPLGVVGRAARCEAARARELAFKRHYAEPPQPRPDHEACVNGAALLARIVQAAERDSWEAGFAEAVFTIGEMLRLLFQPRFVPIWRQVGVPPGPWTALLQAEEML
jgi:hypothetical protein